MKIKRFTAADMRQAIRQVREALGPDAVILSNRSVDGGVELVAAMDYDESFVDEAVEETAAKETMSRSGTGAQATETKSRQAPIDPRLNRSAPANPARPTIDGDSSSTRIKASPMLVEMRREMKELRRMMENELSELAWRDMGQRRPQIQELFRELMRLEFSDDVCRRLVDQVSDISGYDQAWKKAIERLYELVPVRAEDPLEQGGAVAIVGPTGVGKTTTIAKLAARFCLKHGKRHLALISTDNYRIGAPEQLQNYARILDVPLRIAVNEEELNAALNAFAGKRLVLIDTAGMSQRDVRLGERLALLTSGHKSIQSFLALSATTQRSALEYAVKAFGATRPVACVLTKVDEAGALGGALSALIRCGLPVAYTTDGQKVPEDLQVARAHTLVDRAIALGQENKTELSEDFFAISMGGLREHAHV